MSLFTGGVALASALGGSGLGLWGASKQASSAERGAELQAQATKEALDFTKAQKAKQEAAAAPYLSLGGMAAGRLPGVVRQSPQGGPPLPYTTQAQATAPQGPQMMGAQPMGQMGAPMAGGTPGMAAGLVTVQAPTGETMQLSRDQAQQAVSRGARIVG